MTDIGNCKCKHCGFDDWRALQIDHIDGKGYEERKKYGTSGNGRGGTLTRKKQLELITSNPLNYQVLCANCNWIKRYENKETKKRYIL